MRFQEADSLLRSAEVTLGEDDVAALYRQTEGWPAGLYLAALYLREGGPLGTAAVSFGGADRLVSEYMESEFLARISQRHRVFLTRTAVLERMSEPLCEAVLLLLSPHTVKSQAISIYRKLGASSRSQAVARSRELGFLEG